MDKPVVFGTTNTAGKQDIQALSYQYDTLGNLESRATARTNTTGVAVESINESFAYDRLNRLKTSTTSGLFTRFKDYNYDELGNLITRSSTQGTSTVNDDVGTLAYARTNNAGVHAVTSAGGVSYQYDKYGNMTKRGNETITYDVFNKPTRISGINTTDFVYGADHERFKEVSGGTTLYTLLGGLYEEEIYGTTTIQRSYVDGVVVNTKMLLGTTVRRNDNSYLHSDSLGSVEANTDKLGQFVERMSFSDWGKRQFSNWRTSSAPPPAGGYATQRGYTGHHQLDQHDLVHMEGRVYDPNIGRFLSADLVVQSPYSSQSFNRYSYVSNNPLSKTDPTGYCEVGYGYTRYDGGATSGYTSWSTCPDAAGVYSTPGGSGYSSINDITARPTSSAPIDYGNFSALDQTASGLLTQCFHGALGACSENNDLAAESGLLEGPYLPIVLKDFAKMSAELASAGWGKIGISSVRALFKVGAKAGENAAKGGKEIVYRWMSRAELKSTQETGLLRGGREGTHYVTDAANSDPLRARMRSALPQTPEVRVKIEVPGGTLSVPSRVKPDFNMPGGGMERTATGNVPVNILEVF
ncbi:MAG: hypothetical protein EOP49_25055 [Sphingobacteriales bacterium]|nr:MAG: hypothetical protein EOP49_25055 [Sphingobacteriales bacterium]